MNDLDSLRTFLAGPARNGYIRFGTIKAYVRKGHHSIDGELVKTFDLANFENHAKRRGKGEFRSLLPRLRKELKQNKASADIKAIFVENVLNERLAAALPSMGFHLVVPKATPPCFLMWLDK